MPKSGTRLSIQSYHLRGYSSLGHKNKHLIHLYPITSACKVFSYTIDHKAQPSIHLQRLLQRKNLERVSPTAPRSLFAQKPSHSPKQTVSADRPA